jgi:hypothetical protein
VNARFRFNRRRVLTALSCSAALLSACGGGGTDESTVSEAAGDVVAQAEDNNAWNAEAFGSDAALASTDAEDFSREQAQAAADGSRRMKWNPGHYVVVSASEGLAKIDKVLNEIAPFPFVKGIVYRTDWPRLESSKGSYNFAGIDAAVSRTASKGKRLFVLVATKAFSASESAVPAYARSAEYGGGVYKIAISRGGTGENVALWNDRLADRVIALNQALAKRYNLNNSVEGVVFNETALGTPLRPISAAQLDARHRNLARVAVAAQRAFSSSPAIQFMNQPNRDIPLLWPAIQSSKTGFGGPDVFLNDPHISKMLPLHAAGAGKMPIGVQVEAASYRSTSHQGPFAPPPVTSLFAYARDRLHANYVFWVPVTHPPHNPWPKVLNMWGSGSFPKNSSGGLPDKCPAGFSCVRKL